MLDRDRLEAAVAEGLAAIGDPVDGRAELARTPARVAEAASEWFAGIGADPVAALREGRFAAGPGEQSIIALPGVSFTGFCEHHLVPFAGTVDLAVEPGEHLVGFGRLVDLVDACSRRLTLQERMGGLIVDSIMDALEARGAIALVRARHSCLSSRGGRDGGGRVVTTHARGTLGGPESGEAGRAAGRAALARCADDDARPERLAFTDTETDMGTDTDTGAAASEPGETPLAGPASASEAPVLATPDLRPRRRARHAAPRESAPMVDSRGGAPGEQAPAPGGGEAAAALAGGGRTRIMAVLNVTPDSFSDGGRFERDDPDARAEAALAEAERVIGEGAEIIDVGGESTRPGAERVPQEEECARVLPVVRALAAQGVEVSVDTMYAETAAACLEAGARYINDVSGGLADERMLELVAAADAPFILSHWRGHSIRMNDLADYRDPGAEILAELLQMRDAAVARGVRPERIILDPGLGFAKDADHNWSVLERLPDFLAAGHPLLIGASRKRFLGAMLPDGAPTLDRDLPTAVISALCAEREVWGVRVHDVRSTRIAIEVAESMRAGRQRSRRAGDAASGAEPPAEASA